eukprot:scaffold6349_cov232-Chaetoceros_neogracile.AAC.2
MHVEAVSKFVTSDIGRFILISQAVSNFVTSDECISALIYYGKDRLAISGAKMKGSLHDIYFVSTKTSSEMNRNATVVEQGGKLEINGDLWG